MAVIRNPVAYAAWLKRKQMAETQAQNVDTLNQQGAQGIVDQNQLMAILLQQSAIKQAQKRAVSERDSPLGAYTFVFSDAAPLPGFNKRKAAFEDLNIGNVEGERGY